jgi:hypothetical protein
MGVGFGRLRRVKEKERPSFLKKRSKKLLQLGARAAAGTGAKV